MRYLFLWLLSAVGFASAGYGQEAEGAEEIAGRIEATLDGERVVLSSLHSSYLVTVRGDVANVELTQTFENPYDQPLNATYLFPLNKDAAVHAMTMHVGDEVVQAEIQEIRQAQKTFDDASRAGKAAALLKQHRPNMFTQKVANLMPAAPIRVVIEYSHLVPKVDDAFELVVPMVVGPRFQPAGAGVVPSAVAGGATPDDTNRWILEKLPEYPVAAGVHLPASVVGERVSLRVDLEAPVPLHAATSDTHPLTVRHLSSTQQIISLRAGEVLDNKDFVLRYQLGGVATSAGVLSHWQPGEEGYFSLLIEPPAVVPESQAVAREMVFLLDCSGSMSGAPMDASKRFMLRALENLRANDTFRIIRFSDGATEFSRHPLAATSANIAAGVQYTKSLYGSGGTMMSSGISQALMAPIPPATIRNVVFLTDGYIGNEASVLELIVRLRGKARLFAFGVGAGVNRYLLSELGRVGRGFTRYFDPTRSDEGIEAVAAGLAARLQTPLLTDVRIDWGDLPVTQVHPATLPDLYAGDTLRVTGRFTQPAAGEVTIRGQGRGRSASIRRAVHLGDGEERPVLRRVWARAEIAQLMHAFITPRELRPDAMTHEQLQSAVTEVGLNYALSTRWTAFVAVSRKVYNPSGEPNIAANVALPKVAGVSNLAYATPAMTGFGAPEPGLMVGLLAVFATFAGLRNYWRSSPG